MTKNNQQHLDVLFTLANKLKDINDLHPSEENPQSDNPLTDCVVEQSLDIIEEIKNEAQKDFGSEYTGKSLTKEALEIQRDVNNIGEREKLLDWLKIMFCIQMLFMNSIVLIVVIWVVFDIPIFNSLSGAPLKEVIEFIKYYVTAVLAELLGGVIFIVIKVFSYKHNS